MSRSSAEIVREYGPFTDAANVAGVTYDGQNIWFASGDKLNAVDPASGKLLRSIDVAAHAGTAFDGEHLYQLAEKRIQKIDPKSGRVLATIPAPGDGGDSGLTWAEGSGNIETGKFTKSTPKPARSFAPSNPIASSPGSPGSTEISGTPPGKAMRASCGESIPEPARSWKVSRCRPERAFRG
jgi:hypothetical protein